MCDHGYIGACAECDGSGQMPEREPDSCNCAICLSMDHLPDLDP